MFDHAPKPNHWERRPGESEGAYAAFLAYRDLGATRSLERAVSALGDGGGTRGGGKPPTFKALARLSARWGWVERCRAWDNHLQTHRDREAAREAARWERRRLAAIEDAWADAQELRAKVRLMLKMPLTETRLIQPAGPDGAPAVYQVKPIGWRAGDLAALARAAAELEAAALRAASGDPADLTDAALEAIAEPTIVVE